MNAQTTITASTPTVPASTSTAIPIVGSYVCLQRALLQPCKRDGTNLSEPPILSNLNQTITVIDTIQNFAILTIDPYNKESTNYSKFNFSGGSIKYFKL
ncbi:MAG TPA: hypothetical protein VNX68_04440, partial [Nitrosopumilaceae archaeon]|nr:hypothetical protein [Nitrosopumilaceae archaeon]